MPESTIWPFAPVVRVAFSVCQVTAPLLTTAYWPSAFCTVKVAPAMTLPLWSVFLTVRLVSCFRLTTGVEVMSVVSAKLRLMGPQASPSVG